MGGSAQLQPCCLTTIGPRLSRGTKRSARWSQTRSRLKAHHIQAYEAGPDLETMIRLLKSVKHHVPLGGGPSQNNDVKHLSVAWTRAVVRGVGRRGVLVRHGIGNTCQSFWRPNSHYPEEEEEGVLSGSELYQWSKDEAGKDL